MLNTFDIKTKVHFGKDSLKHLQKIINKNVLIIADPFMVQSGLIDKITVNLNQNTTKVFSDIEPDPPIETIVKGIEEINQFKPDIIIALGGGSAIDAAKAIMDFSKKIIGIKAIQFIAIPTTSGTGSEVTSFSVITDQDKGTKYPLVSDDLLPHVAILDPILVQSVPKTIVADTGMDVLTHAIEAYVSTRANDFSDALAEKAAGLVFHYLLKSYKDKVDLEAKEKMHNASCLAGLAFNQTSLGLNHSMAHVLGARFHIPHGRINAMLLPKIIEYNADINSYNPSHYSLAAQKYAKLANLMGFGSSNVRIAVKNLIHEIIQLEKNMKMPTRLAMANVKSKATIKQEEEIASLVLKDGCLTTNPKNVSSEDVIHILHKIM